MTVVFCVCALGLNYFAMKVLCAWEKGYLNVCLGEKVVNKRVGGEAPVEEVHHLN